MKFLLVALILMIPIAFLIGYFAGTMEKYLWEIEDIYNDR